MKHVHRSKKGEVQIRTSEAFSRIGIAMENMFAAVPDFLAASTVEGSKECHGKRKTAKKVA